MFLLVLVIIVLGSLVSGRFRRTVLPAFLAMTVINYHFRNHLAERYQGQLSTKHADELISVVGVAPGLRHDDHPNEHAHAIIYVTLINNSPTISAYHLVLACRVVAHTTDGGTYEFVGFADQAWYYDHHDQWHDPGVHLHPAPGGKPDVVKFTYNNDSWSLLRPSNGPPFNTDLDDGTPVEFGPCAVASDKADAEEKLRPLVTRDVFKGHTAVARFV